MHAHSGSLRELLAVIEEKLTVAAIMTPWEQVDCVPAEATSEEAEVQAMDLMDRHHYSGVPMVWGKNVRGVFLRHDPAGRVSFERIKPEHFIESDIGLVTLIRRMRDTQRTVVGVGSPESPVGWVTYADFSKRPFRVLLFALMAEIEYLLALALDMAHPDDSWIDLLPDKTVEFLQRREDAKHWDVVMPMTTFAEIGDLILAVPASRKALALLGETESIARRLKSIPDLRNRVDHVVRPVVRGPKLISSVANQIDQMLAWAERWTANLAARGGSGVEELESETSSPPEPSWR
jgi:CBS domain-containing protein